MTMPSISLSLSSALALVLAAGPAHAAAPRCAADKTAFMATFVKPAKDMSLWAYANSSKAPVGEMLGKAMTARGQISTAVKELYKNLEECARLCAIPATKCAMADLKDGANICRKGLEAVDDYSTVIGLSINNTQGNDTAPAKSIWALYRKWQDPEKKEIVPAWELACMKIEKLVK